MSAAGSVRVDVQDAEGKQIDGYEASNCEDIYGDEIERIVEWNSGADIGRLQGQPIRLLFYLKDADIYAFRFSDGGQQDAPTTSDQPRR